MVRFVGEIRWWEQGATAGAGQINTADVTARKNWPNPSDYAKSVQRDRPFTDPELLHAKVGTTPLGLPAMATGENAIVFKVDANDDTYAVRCFTPKMGSPNDAIYKHLQQIACPNELVKARWVEGGITVEGEPWPILVMPWIDGKTLNAWLADNAHDRDAVLAVRDRLRDTHVSLRSTNLVHGDLHHGNILITPTGDIRLIDFDGMCAFDPDTNSLITPQPSEVGHPNYQHPQRIRNGSWHPHTDTFGALLIDVSLTIIAAAPDLYQNSGDHLIFTAEDLEDPFSSAQFSHARTLNVADSSNSYGEEQTEYLHLLTTLSEWCKYDEPVDVDFADLLAGHMPEFRTLSPESVRAVTRKDVPVENEWGSQRFPSAAEKEAAAVSAPSYTTVDRDLDDGRIVGIIMLAAVVFLFIMWAVSNGGSSTATAPSPQLNPVVQAPRQAPPPPPIERCVYPGSRPTVARGSQGEDVLLLQTRLQVAADGRFGQQTERAVREFQQSNGLTADGIVGQRTWDALGLTCPSGEQSNEQNEVPNLTSEQNQSTQDVSAPKSSDSTSPLPKLEMKVGACLSIEKTRDGRVTDWKTVDCADSWQAVIISEVPSPGSPQDCPWVVWPGWFGSTEPRNDNLAFYLAFLETGSYFCAAPSRQPEQRQLAIGSCVRFTSANVLTVASCQEIYDYKIYDVVPIGADCPQPDPSLWTTEVGYKLSFDLGDRKYCL